MVGERLGPALARIASPVEGLVFDRGHWAGLTLYPTSKCSPARAVDMLESFGCERVCMNSAADWGESNPLATLEAASEMRIRGHPEQLVERIFWENPKLFLGQCPKFTP